MNDLGLGVVGCGGAGIDVARAAASTRGLSVVAAQDLDRGLAEDLARDSGARVHDSLTQLLDDRRVEIVYVAVPHDLLAQIARTALLAGRHVLVEKPMAIAVEDIDELEAVARTGQRTLGVLYEMRFAPVAVAARRLVRDGAIGQVTAIRIRTLIDKVPGYWQAGLTGRSKSPWRGQLRRAGGGVVLMNTSHQLDLAASITKLQVTGVMAAIATSLPDIDVEDTAAVVLEFSNGAIGSLTAGAHVPGADDDETLEIDGSSGRLILNPYSGRLTAFLRRAWRGHPAGRWFEPDISEADPFVLALGSFATAVRTAARPATGAPEARAVLATVQAIYRSAAESRRVEPG